MSLESQNKAYEMIMDILLALSEFDRIEVIDNLEVNNIFCWRCAVGDEITPNKNCHCWNDE